MYNDITHRGRFLHHKYFYFTSSVPLLNNNTIDAADPEKLSFFIPHILLP